VRVVTDLMFNLETKTFVGFYRKSLNNMLKFWCNLNRSKMLKENEENINLNIVH